MSLCSKRKSPSVQDRRLKLDALVENIKSLKAAELKEQSISVDVKDTTSSEIGLPQGTISCEKEVSASLKNEERLDSLNQQIDNNDSNCVKFTLLSIKRLSSRVCEHNTVLGLTALTFSSLTQFDDTDIQHDRFF
jgi:hypothetical protein